MIGTRRLASNGHLMSEGWAECSVCLRQLPLRSDGLIPAHVPRGASHKERSAPRCPGSGSTP